MVLLVVLTEKSDAPPIQPLNTSETFSPYCRAPLLPYLQSLPISPPPMSYSSPPQLVSVKRSPIPSPPSLLTLNQHSTRLPSVLLFSMRPVSPLPLRIIIDWQSRFSFLRTVSGPVSLLSHQQSPPLFQKRPVAEAPLFRTTSSAVLVLRIISLVSRFHLCPQPLCSPSLFFPLPSPSALLSSAVARSSLPIPAIPFLLSM